MKIVFLFTLSMLFTCSILAQTIHYVKPNAIGGGSSWTNAFGDLQAAINAAASGDEVWVAAGDYKPALNASFIMKEGVKIYGHFAGTETSLAQRDLRNSNTSYLTGNGKQVIFNNNNGLTNAAILNGFVIRNGVDDGFGGGGMYCNNVKPVIENCEFLSNSGSDGGAVCNKLGAFTTFRNCIFRTNSAFSGGAVYNAAEVNLFNCLIYSNETNGGLGGAILNLNGSTVNIVNCTIIYNYANNNNSGGGIANEGILNMKNTILYFNGSTYGFSYNDIYPISGSVNNIDFSNLYAPSNLPLGTSNIQTDPALIGATANPRLKCESPCINKGNNDYLAGTGITFDLDGFGRIQNGKVNIGAYEVEPLLLNYPPASRSVSDTRYITFGTVNNVVFGFCDGRIANIYQSGDAPVSGLTTAKLWIESAPLLYNGQYLLSRHYEITPVHNPSSATARIRLSFLQSEFDAYNQLVKPGDPLLPQYSTDSENINNLVIHKLSGSTSDGSGLPDTYLGSETLIDHNNLDISWDSNLNCWHVSFEVIGFSGFFVNSMSTALPVSFGSISAYIKNNLLQVNWETFSETNNKYFKVRASTDGNSWKTIGTLQTLAKDGKSDAILKYQYSIPLTVNLLAISAILIIAISFISSKNLISHPKNSNRWIIYSFVFATLLGVSCRKNERIKYSADSNLYIRIVQVDKDDTEKASKVITAIKM